MLFHAQDQTSLPNQCPEACNSCSPLLEATQNCPSIGRKLLQRCEMPLRIAGQKGQMQIPRSAFDLSVR